MEGDENDPLGPIPPPIHQGTKKDRVQTSAVRLGAARRRILAMQLRQAGYEYKEIGKRLGCSTQRAHMIVQDEFKRLRAEQNELAENILKVSNDRIERLIRVHWQKALKGDRFANEMLLKLIDRQARLFGVDAPKKSESKIEVTNNTDDPERLKAQARMRGIDYEDLEVESGEAKSPTDERVLSYRPQDRAGCDEAGDDSSDGRERVDSGDTSS